MRKSRSKKLMRLAEVILIANNIPLGDGYGEYNQAMNCHAWVPALDEDGKRKLDGDGTPLLKHTLNPGTITCKETLRNVYQNLKRLWKTNPSNQLFANL